jgi:hypothetical protein
MPGAVWFGDFLDGTIPSGAALIGNAVLDPDFGINVDGAGDYVTVSASQYAQDGTFSVSSWFTRQGECNLDNRFGDASMQPHTAGSVKAVGRVRGSADTIGVSSTRGVVATALGDDAHVLGIQAALLGHSGVEVRSSQRATRVRAGRHVNVAAVHATVRAGHRASSRSMNGAVLLVSARCTTPVPIRFHPLPCV